MLLSSCVILQERGQLHFRPNFYKPVTRGLPEFPLLEMYALLNFNEYQYHEY